MENHSKPQGPNNKKPKMVRINLYWMYALIALTLIGLYYFNGSSSSKEVTWSEFENIARNNGIKQIVVYTNKDYLEAYINDSTAQAIFKTTADKIGKNPKIYTNIASADAFDKNVETWRKENGFKAMVRYDKSSDFSNMLFSFLPIILLFAFWFFMMRRMSGQGGGSGGVFNVGKAKAQLFDKEGPVQVSFKDVAGLSEA